MATVRFSVELRDRIRRNAEDLFTGRINAAKDDYDKDMGLELYDLAVQDIKHHWEQVPEWMYNTIDTVGISKIVYAPDANKQALGVFIRHLKLPTSMPWPKQINHACMGITDADYGGSFVIDASDDRWDDVVPQIEAYQKKIDDLTAEKHKFVQGVNKVTSAFTTLAPALKEWPPLWDLLPDDVKDRHREVKARTKKEVQPIAADLSGMTAAVAAVKLTR